MLVLYVLVMFIGNVCDIILCGLYVLVIVDVVVCEDICNIS